MEIRLNLPADLEEILGKYQEAYAKRIGKRITKTNALIIMCRKSSIEMSKIIEKMNKEYNDYHK